MMTDGKNEGTPPEEGDDALWRLLERAPQPKPVSPYFARRVLRDVALLAETRPAASGMLNWLARTWQAWLRPGVAFAGALVAAAACAFVVAALSVAGGVGFSSLLLHVPAAPLAISRPEPAKLAVPVPEATVHPDEVVENDPVPEQTVALSADPVVTAQDVEVIADLDNLLSREESRLWTEDDTARF